MSSLTDVRFAVGATFTLLNLGKALESAMHSHGLTPILHNLPMGRALTDLGSPELIGFRPDIVAMFLHCDEVIPADWSISDLDTVEQSALAKIELIKDQLAQFANASGALVVINTVAISDHAWRSVISWKHRAALGRMWRALNSSILQCTELSPQLHVLDLELLSAVSGVKVSDQRLLAAANAAWGRATERLVAQELARFAVAFAGGSKRVVATDFDDTLWGGVAAEVGVEGVHLGGPFYPGNAFTAFQRGLRRLKEQGVVLVGASKNEWETARRVMEGHPDCVLRPQDFASMAVGWDPKPLMLREVLTGLDISPDHCVFVDDSAGERAAVADNIPEMVTVDSAPPERAFARLVDAAIFDVLDLTQDDHRRTESYRGRRQRDISQADSGSTQAFLAGLGTTVTIDEVGPGELARFLQLGDRTNQFNTSGRRYGKHDLVPGGSLLPLYFSVRDRFIDEGQVGGLAVQRRACALVVDNFFMSCRVMGRAVELGVLAWLGDAAARAGITTVHLRFVETERNGPARNALLTARWERLDCQICGPTLAMPNQTELSPPSWLSLDADPGLLGRRLSSMAQHGCDSAPCDQEPHPPGD